METVPEALVDVVLPAQRTPDHDVNPSPSPRRRPEVRGGRLILLAILTAAGFADAWQVGHDAIHMYYAAAVRSMSSDWHAFAFGGFDRPATISVDKLPGGLWVQALSARLFGMSTPALVLPEVIAGVAAVYVLHRAVRRTYGQAAGLVAAAVLAVTPAAITSVRGDVPDGLCVLLLVLAVSATLNAVETGRLRTLLLAALWVGLAFQVKMLEAWFVVPGLGLAYLVAAPGPLRRRLAHGAAALGLLVVVSLSYMTVVSLTPAVHRPYVDGSAHNSIFEQVFVYNGLGRFGDQKYYGLAVDLPYTPHVPDDPPVTAPSSSASGSLGELTWHRLVTGPTGREGGWALPLALCVAGGIVLARRRRARDDRLRAAAIAWGGWLVPAVFALSASHVILAYYVGAIAPPVAALAGIGAVSAYRGLAGRGRRWAPVVAAGLLLASAVLLCLDGDVPWWLLILVSTVGAGATLCAALGSRQPRMVFAGLVLALLAGPAASAAALVAAGATAWDAPYAHGGTLRQAASGVPNASYGGVIMLHTSAAMWKALDVGAHRLSAQADDAKIVYFTAATAAQYYAGGGDRAVTIGGYTGLVGAPTADDLIAMLNHGEIVFAVVPTDLDWRYNDPRLVALYARCQRVDTVSSTVYAVLRCA